MHIGFIEIPLITIPLIIIFSITDDSDDRLFSVFLTILFGVTGVTLIFLGKFYRSILVKQDCLLSN